MVDESFIKDGLRFECTGCGDCCRTHGDYAYVYLADKDVVNIARKLGISQVDFLNAHCRSDENGNIHLTMVDGACNFLDENGRCRVYEVRPRQCSAWPFWTENLNRADWEGEISSCCKGVGRGRCHSKEEILEIANDRNRWYGIDF